LLFANGGRDTCFSRLKGSLSFTSDGIFSRIPQFLILGLISTKSYVGNHFESFLNFQNFNVSQITVRSERDAFMTRSLQLDFANDLYLSAYMSLLNALKGTGRPMDNGFSFEDYKISKNLFLFSLAPTPVTSGSFAVAYGGHVLV